MQHGSVAQTFVPLLTRLTEEVHRELGATLRGIVVSRAAADGSFPGPLRILILAAGAEPEWRMLTRDAFPLEIYRADPARLAGAALEGLLEVADLITSGIVIEPCGDDCETLLSTLRRSVHGAPALAPPSAQEIAWRCTRVRQLIASVRRIATSDHAAAQWLSTQALMAIVELYYRLEERPQPEPALVLDDLRRHAPDLEPRVRRMLSSDATPEARCLWADELLHDMVRPGGHEVPPSTDELRVPWQLGAEPFDPGAGAGADAVG